MDLMPCRHMGDRTVRLAELRNTIYGHITHRFLNPLLPALLIDRTVRSVRIRSYLAMSALKMAENAGYGYGTAFAK